MKNLLLGTLALASLPLFANAPIQEELYVVGNDPELVRELARTQTLSVDHVDSHGFEVYGPKGTAKFLKEKGVLFLNMKANKSAKEVDWTSYPSFEILTAKLQEFATKYPNLVKITSIGKSVQGRDLWVLKISDNVNVDEVEPEFKYISSMHGDEITGRELTVRLIDEMLSKYGKDQRITDLIDNTELYIMPSMNPDGSHLRQRANAKGIDLNRHFPEAVRNQPNSTNNKQPEVAAIMNFQASRNFTLSANFHGGTIVANYPWDAKYEAHPLDALVQELSLAYSELNPEMTASDEFSRGITNGAAWYVVEGGMQDWSYVWHNDLQITIELSHAKWPNYKDIPGFYKSNRESMIRYAELIHQGAGVKFADKKTTGKVAIKDANGKSLGSYGFQRGEFYKVLLPGTYTFDISAGNKKKSVSVTVTDAVRSNGNYVQL